jgi:hypothetical protein
MASFTRAAQYGSTRSLNGSKNNWLNHETLASLFYAKKGNRRDAESAEERRDIFSAFLCALCVSAVTLVFLSPHKLPRTLIRSHLFCIIYKIQIKRK